MRFVAYLEKVDLHNHRVILGFPNLHGSDFSIVSIEKVFIVTEEHIGYSAVSEDGVIIITQLR